MSGRDGAGGGTHNAGNRDAALRYALCSGKLKLTLMSFESFNAFLIHTEPPFLALHAPQRESVTNRWHAGRRAILGEEGQFGQSHYKPWSNSQACLTEHGHGASGIHMHRVSPKLQTVTLGSSDDRSSSAHLHPTLKTRILVG